MRFSISIELVVVTLFILTLVIWAIWFKLSTRRSKRKYKKYHIDNDLGKKAEESRKFGLEGGKFERGELGRREPKVEDAISSVPRFTPVESRELLPTTSVDNSRQDFNGSGKSSNSTGEFGRKRRRNPFRRRR